MSTCRISGRLARGNISTSSPTATASGATGGTGRSRAQLRTTAYQQAKMLVKGSTVFQARYTHLLGTLTKQQAYVAVANAYLRTAHLLVTTGELWNEETRVRRR